jgi:hypothetical protein
MLAHASQRGVIGALVTLSHTEHHRIASVVLKACSLFKLWFYPPRCGRPFIWRWLGIARGPYKSAGAFSEFPHCLTPPHFMLSKKAQSRLSGRT